MSFRDELANISKNQEKSDSALSKESLNFLEQRALKAAKKDVEMVKDYYKRVAKNGYITTENGEMYLKYDITLASSDPYNRARPIYLYMSSIANKVCQELASMENTPCAYIYDMEDGVHIIMDSVYKGSFTRKTQKGLFGEKQITTFDIEKGYFSDIYMNELLSGLRNNDIDYKITLRIWGTGDSFVDKSKLPNKTIDITNGIDSVHETYSIKTSGYYSVGYHYTVTLETKIEF